MGEIMIKKTIAMGAADAVEPALVPVKKPARAKVKRVSTSDLKLVVIGRGQTAGRTPNLVRLRPAVIKNLRQYADGPIYLLIEIALEKLAEQLAARPAGSKLEIVRAEEMD